MTLFDCIVVGGGIVGSSAAYHCAKNGQKVILLEQFGLPHVRGSSHGQSRIIRKAYEKQCYAAMMPDAYQLWQEIERESKCKLYKHTGMLTVGGADSESLDAYVEVMKKLDFPYTVLSPGEFRHCYPMFQYSSDYGAMLDRAAGMLRADVCLRALWKLIEKNGGRIQDGAQVTEINEGEIVRVKTVSGTYRGKSVILTPGPWANKLLNSIGVYIPLKPVRVTVCYYRVKEPGTYSDVPILVHWVGPAQRGRLYYMIPDGEYPGMVKMATRSTPYTETHPNGRDGDLEASRRDIQIVSNYIREHVPGVEAQPCIVETAMYTFTPDDDYVIDYHPKHKNIVFGCGFSGHGFKLAPITGKLLYEMASKKNPSFDISKFSIARFHNVSKL